MNNFFLEKAIEDAKNHTLTIERLQTFAWIRDYPESPELGEDMSKALRGVCEWIAGKGTEEQKAMLIEFTLQPSPGPKPDPEEIGERYGD